MKKSKKKKLTIKINPNEITIRNTFHFDVQRTTRMQVVQSKKHKKEKHKKDYLRDIFD